MATKVAPKQFHEKLVKANESTTDRWDVIVSYTKDKLQPLLDRDWSQAIGETTVSITHSTGHKQYDRTTTYTITLASPHFEFDTKEIDGGSLSRAKITWGFTGTAHVKLNSGEDKGTEQLTAEDGLTLTVKTPINAIEDGDASNDEKTSHDMIEFTDGVRSSYKVILQFKSTEDTLWEVNYTKKSDTAEELQDVADDIGAELNNQDKIKGFKFTLGEVNNTPNPNDFVLTPKKFCFGVFKDIFCIFIHVEGGDGTGSVGTPQFKLLHEEGIAPMPDGYDASIILSRNLIRDKYLIPQIADKCKDILRTEDPIVAQDATLGPSIGLKFQDSRVWEGHKYTAGPTDEDGYISVDWDKHPLVLTLFDDPSTLHPQYKWEWNDAEVTLTYFVYNAKLGRVGQDITIKGKISQNASSVATLSGDNLKFHIAFSSNNQPDASFKDVGPVGLSGSVKFKTFDVSLLDINFFRTQNVLAPGQRFISAKETMCPCDFFIFGSMEDAKK
ncbi:hypothetical protein UA08_07439 [Talaromyces atroroseus]|uniref:Uncharacterized protein n=1 Tax=Talaromyces atroroseus TaxID=1441469 RepID=A0A225AAI2_TALAT|nr:hypothetical protein UA08_07439 [Talaromyces atroroseus]OKL57160.1 hypothetical protein UA08_07439 [Talaromyces atroroseus]